MASTNSPIIPSSPPPPPPESTHDQFAYDVFLSFRGVDTRYGFTDHLYHALISCGIRSFRDDNELERGRVIMPDLIKAIEESKIFVVVFSELYATSKPCLRELTKMREEKRLILPIFYKVSTDEVGSQETGSYAKAFRAHEVGADERKKKEIENWRTAVTEVSRILGYDLEVYRYETSLIQKLIDDILGHLNFKLPIHVDKNIVGMNSRLETLRSLIKPGSEDEVRIIGIWGPSGTGKSLISKVVFNDIFRPFESRVFLENVRGRSKDDHGKLGLQKELLRDALKKKDLKINSLHEGINMIKYRLFSQKVLLILDDVDTLEQLNFLVGERGWFRPGSRIILTTTNLHLLQVHEVDKIYKVEELKPKDSLQLFCQHAFKQNTPAPGYEGLSIDVVEYAGNLPLALIVLGSTLFDREKLYWESIIKELEKKPIGDVQDVLRISYDRLDSTSKEMFLDIACFFKGWKKNDVTRLHESSDAAITNLTDLCLITLPHNVIHMHDLVQKMGREIVREKNPREPGKWSRLWDPKDISDHVLKRKKGTENIEGVFLDMSKLRGISITTEAFRKMENLRLLKIYWDDDFPNYRSPGFANHKLLLPNDFEFPSYDLRYLNWDRYSLESLPSNFDGEELVELNLSDSSIRHLWTSEKCPNLKILNLSRSKELMDMPSFSNESKLEQLNFEDCRSLDQVDSSIGFLKNLTLLNLRGCQKIKSLPGSIGDLALLEILYLDSTAIEELSFSMRRLTRLYLLSAICCDKLKSLPTDIYKLESLKYLYLCVCPKLETFPEILEDMKCLEDLDLSKTGIKELPSSIEFLTHLTSLDLGECKNLKTIPDSICKLKLLRSLVLKDCSNLETFPNIMEDMTCLNKLDLSGTVLEELPSSISFLSRLTSLGLEDCKNLRILSDDICKLKSLRSLSLKGCSKLETFPQSMEDMECLKELDLSKTAIKELPSSLNFPNQLTSLTMKDCQNLRTVPGNICGLKSLQYLVLDGCSNLESFPEIMEDMKRLKHLLLNRTCVKLKSLPSSICRLTSLTCLFLGGCSGLETFPENMEGMKCLQKLELSETAIKELPSSIGYLNHLAYLYLSYCKNLRSLPSGITQLSKLECLNIKHCEKLEVIPELPSSLREMDAHDCPRLRSLSNSSTLLKLIRSSLLKWPDKVKLPSERGIMSRRRKILPWEGGKINVGSKGIPEWVLHQEVRRSQIGIELPMNWHEDEQFLGFVFFFLHLPELFFDLSLKFDEEECVYEEIYFPPLCQPTRCTESDELRLWVLYCPKNAIMNKLCSNDQYRRLEASFDFFTIGRQDKFKGCGVHLIYSQDHQPNPVSVLDFPKNLGKDRLCLGHG